jgi:predicted DNA-binding transcriptional regulator YafY
MTPRPSLRPMKDGIALITDHARVLLCIARHPDWTVVEIADALETSERQVFRWLNDLQAAGYLTRMKSGRRNRYVLRPDAPLREDPAARLTLSEFLALAAGQAGRSGSVELHRLPAVSDRP